MLTTDTSAAFTEALFAYSEVLDGPKPKQPPKFTEGANMLQFMLRVRVFEERQEQAEGRKAFESYRLSYLNTLAEYIRFAALLKRLGREISTTPGTVSPREAQAISLLLAFGSEELQDTFLRGEPDFRDAIVAAILADGGLYDERDFWVELPT